MKFFVIFALALAIVSAFDLRNAELKQRNIVKPAIESDGRITNGFKADPRYFPFQVGLNLSLFDNTLGWCSGSLISTTFVLTSAYCLEFTIRLTIYFGSTKRTSPEKEVTVKRSDFIIHEDYDIKTLENNIGLIKFPAITYTNTIKPALLPPDYIIGDPTFYDKSVIIPGWGLTAENGSLAEDLQFALSKIISNDECAKSMENIFDTSICISTEEGSSPCQGDSGSPLVLIAQKYVVGVFSFTSTHGCTKDYPAVFERVTSYLPWIKKHAGIES